MKSTIAAVVAAIVIGLAAYFLPDAYKLNVLIVLIPAVLFLPKTKLVHEFLKFYEEDTTITPTIGTYILSYFFGYKYCAQRCGRIRFMISTIIDVIAIAPLICMFSLNFFGRNALGIITLIICTLIMCAGALVLILPRFTVEEEDRILGYIWIGTVVVSAIIVLVLPLPIRVILTQYYILFTLVAVYISKIIDTQNILSHVGRISFASYLPLFGAGSLAYQIRCETYGNDKYELH